MRRRGRSTRAKPREAASLRRSTEKPFAGLQSAWGEHSEARARCNIFRLLGLALLVLGFAGCSVPAEDASKKLVVHEWGTFTSLQDEKGNAIGGINTDDEPVPKFIHRLRDLVIPPTELPPSFFKGVPQSHPDVTLRLETPVIYFYPPKTGTDPLKADVRVSFRGGWLTEYYPDAQVEAPGLESGKFDFGHLTREQTGSLTWKGLSIGGDHPGPPTTDQVWASPRQVQAASISNSKGESEKFLFYRGVGQIDAPLRLARENDLVTISSQLDPSLLSAATQQIKNLWLVHVHSDGTAAFRALEPISITHDATVAARVTANFREEEFSNANLDRLSTSMRTALVGQGLFDDEALALIRTWERAYFKSPGLRFFFLVPPVWTDHYLPLQVSTAAEVKRVMIGRIELVTPQQRKLLQRIAAGPASDGRWLQELHRRPINGSAPLSSLDIGLPEDYRAYIALGRFRNALVLDEANRHSTKPLKQFIANYGLHGYRVRE